MKYFYLIIDYFIMQRTDILQKIGLIIQNTLKNKSVKISEETEAKDFKNWDSLNHIHIILEVEKQFNIKMTATQISKLKNIGSIIDIINNKNFK